MTSEVDDQMKKAWAHFFNHHYTFWGILCLPAVLIVYLALSRGLPLGELLHPTGEFAARFMIIALMVSPLTILFKRSYWPFWLLERRRYLGVASFMYALAHTVFYIADLGLIAFSFEEILQISISSGWLAFILFVPLAVTSTDGWVKRLRKRWKSLQRIVYGAAVLTLLHWAALHDWGGVVPALVHFAPLCLLQLVRVAKRY